MKTHMNYTLLCDFYELTMANGYFQTGLADQICYFDVFFRSVPDEGGFAIAAGLEQVIDYIEHLSFDDEDIDYLRGKGNFCEPSASQGTSGRFPRARLSFPVSPFSQSARPPSRLSLLRPSYC